MGVAFPLDSTATSQADDVFYCKYQDHQPAAGEPPLFDDAGNRVPLTADHPRQESLRQDWLSIYQAAHDHNRDGSVPFPSCGTDGHEHHDPNCPHCKEPGDDDGDEGGGDPQEDDPEGGDPDDGQSDIDPIGPIEECPLCEIIAIEWTTVETWCGDYAGLRVTSSNCPDGKVVPITIYCRQTAEIVGETEVVLMGDSGTVDWRAINIPPQAEATNPSGQLFGCYEELLLDAYGGGEVTPAPLIHNMIPKTELYTHAKSSGLVPFEFDLYTDEYETMITATGEYVKGWAGMRVKLGLWTPFGRISAHPAHPWFKYWWMKEQDNDHVYWDGSEWQPLPDGFVLTSENYYTEAFYDNGSGQKGRFGFDFPETFPPWTTTDAQLQAVFTRWAAAIKDRWSKHFKLRRDDCEATAIDHSCCTYPLLYFIRLIKKASYSSGDLIIVEQDVREDSECFTTHMEDWVAVHEYGHWIGLGDEYEGGGGIDRSLNEDGAVNGIDPTSVMGGTGDGVIFKKRHYLTTAEGHELNVQRDRGKSYTYEPVPK